MTKEIRMTKPEMTQRLGTLRYSSFVIPSSFVLRPSSFAGFGTGLLA